MSRKILFCMVSVCVLVFSGIDRVWGQDLCEEYLHKYQHCVDLQNAGRNLDYDECKGYTDEGTCTTKGCYWYADKNRCIIDICLMDGNLDCKATGVDLGILKKEYGRMDCSCRSNENCEYWMVPCVEDMDCGYGNIPECKECCHKAGHPMQGFCTIIGWCD